MACLSKRLSFRFMAPNLAPVKSGASLKVSECDAMSRGRSQSATGITEGILKLEEVVVHELPYA